MKSTGMLAILVLGLVVCSTKVVEAVPIGTAFTYQGYLIDSKKPADGLYDFMFKLYDDPNVIDSNQVGSVIDINDLDVIDGSFTVELDFGSGIFTGEARWLETVVRQGASSDPCDFVTLSPRQELTPTPYAVYTATVPPAIAGSIIPKGGIIMWSGSIASIPTGWALCNGTNGTPDLTSRFIRSVPNASTDPGSTGGSSTHTHSAGSYSASSHTHPYSGATGGPSDTTQRGDKPEHSASTTHTHTYSGTTSSGGGGSISGTSAAADNLPPFYALAFIMKL